METDEKAANSLLLAVLLIDGYMVLSVRPAVSRFVCSTFHLKHGTLPRMSLTLIFIPKVTLSG